MKRLALLLAALALAASGPQVLAQSAAEDAAYPSRPVRLIIPWPPGGSNDVLGRLLAQRLSETTGQPVVVDNRASAGGILGQELGAKAAPDGYTLTLATSGTMSITPFVYDKLGYDPLTSYELVTLYALVPYMMVVTPTVEARDVREFIALAKSKPGGLNLASTGTGSINHLAGELFASLADINVTHVPYRGGGPAMVDLIAGRVQYEFDGTASLGQVKAGKVKILAVTSKERWSVFPDVPTVAETVPGFDAITWYGLFAPAGTPKAIVDLLNAKANAAIRTKAAVDGLNQLSIDPGGGSPDVLAKQVRGEIDKWVDIARKRNIRITE